MTSLIGIDFANLDWQKTAKSGHEQPSKAAAELGAIQLVDSLFPIS
ncbi:MULTISPECIES: hypothetical protein [Pseudomonas]|nr:MULTISPECIES: hypothetical protein [Pseudomonas]EJB8385936.1 hypothetical protein [Pseudomonas aeruginosa]